MDDGEDTFRKTPEARGGAMEKDKEKESDLRDAFADLHFEKNVLEVNASETISASAERQNERQDFFAENKKLLEAWGGSFYHRSARRARKIDFQSFERTDAEP